MHREKLPDWDVYKVHCIKGVFWKPDDDDVLVRVHTHTGARARGQEVQ